MNTIIIFPLSHHKGKSSQYLINTYPEQSRHCLEGATLLLGATLLACSLYLYIQKMHSSITGMQNVLVFTECANAMTRLYVNIFKKSV